MSNTEMFNSISLLTVAFLSFYSIAVLLAWFYDKSKNASTKFFAVSLAIVLTVTYIASAAFVLAAKSGIEGGVLFGVIAGVTALMTAGYIAYRISQEKAIVPSSIPASV